MAHTFNLTDTFRVHKDNALPDDRITYMHRTALDTYYSQVNDLTPIAEAILSLVHIPGMCSVKKYTCGKWDEGRQSADFVQEALTIVVKNSGHSHELFPTMVFYYNDENTNTLSVAVHNAYIQGYTQKQQPKPLKAKKAKLESPKRFHGLWMIALLILCSISLSSQSMFSVSAAAGVTTWDTEGEWRHSDGLSDVTSYKFSLGIHSNDILTAAVSVMSTGVMLDNQQKINYRMIGGHIGAETFDRSLMIGMAGGYVYDKSSKYTGIAAGPIGRVMPTALVFKKRRVDAFLEGQWMVFYEDGPLPDKKGIGTSMISVQIGLMFSL
jgi:hypothetical protein